MINDLICYNGKMSKWSDIEFHPDYLLSTNYVYQKIHAFEHIPLHCELHIEIANNSYTELYGQQLGLTPEVLTKEVKQLLSHNRYPLGSALVMLYIFPPQRGTQQPTRILSCERQLLYKRYVLWHSPMKGIVLEYEPAFLAHKCASSLNAHSYAESYARLNSADVVITENRDGIITSVGEHPFFAVREKRVYTSPIADGAVDSVERRIGISACGKWGNGITQVPIYSKTISQFEEMFFITPQGIVSIGELDGRLYPNSAADAIASIL